MKSKRYFQLVERESSEVSLKWKVCHTVLFIFIALSSIIASRVFSQIFDTFNSRCILYAEPVFIVDNIGKFNKSELKESVTESINDSTTEYITEATTITNVDVITSRFLAPAAKIQFSNKRQEDKNYKDIEDWNFSKKIPGTDYYYLVNNTVFFKNESIYAEIEIKMTITDFSSSFTCDYIRFTALGSVIAASALAGIVIMYGRGGRGYPADVVRHGWRHVYIMLIASAVLFISFVTATNLANNGIQKFCSYFSEFTNTIQCNNYIDYFTVHTILGYQPFYTDYLTMYYTFLTSTGLWAAQLLLITFRLASIADFQFLDLVVKMKTGNEANSPKDKDEVEEEQFQKIYRALKEIEKGTLADSKQHVDEEDSDQNTESTAQV